MARVGLRSDGTVFVMNSGHLSMLQQLMEAVLLAHGGLCVGGSSRGLAMLVVLTPAWQSRQQQHQFRQLSEELRQVTDVVLLVCNSFHLRCLFCRPVLHHRQRLLRQLRQLLTVTTDGGLPVRGSVGATDFGHLSELRCRASIASMSLDVRRLRWQIMASVLRAMLV